MQGTPIITTQRKKPLKIYLSWTKPHPCTKFEPRATYPDKPTNPPTIRELHFVLWHHSFSSTCQKIFNYLPLSHKGAQSNFSHLCFKLQEIFFVIRKFFFHNLCQFLQLKSVPFGDINKNMTSYVWSP